MHPFAMTAYTAVKYTHMTLIYGETEQKMQQKNCTLNVSQVDIISQLRWLWEFYIGFGI